MRFPILASLALAASLFTTLGATAQEVPSWIRHNAISPDGKLIAFSYKGDIFTVPTTGGEARQLTSNKAYESDPLWTPDGSRIVFTSWREGSKDIYVSPKEGGQPTRLTTLPGNETPLCVAQDGTVYFTWYESSLQSPDYDGFPGRPALYATSLGEGGGGAPRLVTSMTLCALSLNDRGEMLYEDWKGVEDPLRKHHTSSVTRDIWLCKPAQGGSLDRHAQFRQLSTYKGEDRNPVFAADGDTFYYLSEQDGKAFNVYKSSVSNPSRTEQLTFHENAPVRFLSVSRDGTVAYSWNGDLYTVQGGKVNITLYRDEDQKDINPLTLKGASDMAVSPDGKEVALVIRGDVFVTSVDFNTTRRITNTPEQERGVRYSEDGRTLYYASERDGCWSVFGCSLADKDEKGFTYAVHLQEKRLTPENETSFQMEPSPDGKWIAYLRDRTELVVIPAKGGKPRSLHKGVNYSYADGDQKFCWSPDSRYLLCNWIADGGWNNEDVAMVELENGKITNLTQSGYSDGEFRWALGGKAMTWTSDKNGFRSHGSWGAESDIYVMFFDGKAWRDFARSKEQKAIDKLLAGEKETKKQKEKKDSTESKKPEKLVPDLAHREDRIRRLTRHSNHIGDHYLTPDGENLYFTQRLERDFDLCKLNLEKGDLSVIRRGVRGRFVPDKDGKHLFLFQSSRIVRLTLSGDKTDEVSFTGEYEFKPQAERTCIFEHCWRQVKEKFYREDLHGTNWQWCHDNYIRFLPYINNYFDFQDLLSEMLGELNASHTGARFMAMSPREMGHLGVLFDTRHTGDGLRIAETLPGGVLPDALPDLCAGDVVTAIEGHEIKAGDDWMKWLYDRVGKRTVVQVRRGGKQVECIVLPAQSDAKLLYRRWVRQREETVHRLSGGRVGYVHVAKMDSPSFRELYAKALGKYRQCDALIVDTRHNGGGWLHDDLVTFLGGKEYVRFIPRGQYIGHEPFNKWTKPSCVLMCEDNYSDACGFPYAYRSLGLGKLIGAPVPGTMTAVWWERQINGMLVFGIPQVGNWGIRDGQFIENFQIEPDILVHNDPASVLGGRDLQLEAAVREMLSQIGHDGK